MNAPKFYEWQQNECEAKKCPHLYRDGQNGNDSEGPKLLKLLKIKGKNLFGGDFDKHQPWTQLSVGAGLVT